jgi:hypothetical protein
MKNKLFYFDLIFSVWLSAAIMVAILYSARGMNALPLLPLSLVLFFNAFRAEDKEKHKHVISVICYFLTSAMGAYSLFDESQLSGKFDVDSSLEILAMIGFTVGLGSLHCWILSKPRKDVN